MSISIFRNLVVHFFLSLLKDIEYERDSDKIEDINLNFDIFKKDDSEYLYRNEENVIYTDGL